MSRSLQVSIFLLAALCLVFPVDAFTTIAPVTNVQPMSHFTSTAMPAFEPSSSMDIAAGTLDPTTILSDILGGLIGSPAILLVPIGAAIAVASLIAFLIISYANPVVEDDEI
mmetsp:Transcript_42570/g.102969  ORF Transcript_42570/g.102969 Transcript_42570/m.102969 type:complete len:112 (-) Transcript_42570:239-574(-)|eukprot:CAMPEP_0113628300 /NCGR_PEP_ID=MMETSP0017_2-20120614/14663_1 /TAXON_ID=2856 /ORGANISM="Cylindrotheca closterium" /LENGTH=111 /DNA_ID=CAMNT_0000538599 /DNA_START=24 /DNA_END=359 /DNA_ORIENTATION=+ /assembly_acc=CAM_ASM_000147